MAAAFEAPAALTTAESAMAAERVAGPVPAAEPAPSSPWSLRTAHDIGGPRTRTGDVVLAEPADFESLLLSRPVLEGLRAAGFERPSPVQLKAIPLGRCGLGEGRGPPGDGAARPARAPGPRRCGARRGSRRAIDFVAWSPSWRRSAVRDSGPGEMARWLVEGPGTPRARLRVN